MTVWADCTVSVMSDNFGFVQLPLTCIVLSVLFRLELQAFEVCHMAFPPISCGVFNPR